MSNGNLDDILKEIREHGGEKEAGEKLRKKLNADQTKRLNEVLGDRKKLEELLSTDRAKELFKKLTGDKNG